MKSILKHLSLLHYVTLFVVDNIKSASITNRDASRRLDRPSAGPVPGVLVENSVRMVHLVQSGWRERTGVMPSGATHLCGGFPEDQHQSGSKKTGCKWSLLVIECDF